MKKNPRLSYNYDNYFFDFWLIKSDSYLWIISNNNDNEEFPTCA